MKTFYVIKDVKTGQYFCQYRSEETFTSNATEAATFKSEEAAVKEMEEEYLEDFFNGRILEVRKFYSFYTKFS